MTVNEQKQPHKTFISYKYSEAQALRDEIIKNSEKLYFEILV